MRLEYIGLSELSGSLIALEGVKNVAYDEMAEVTLENGERRYGRVILIDGDRVVLQVFEGTRGISLENASTHFTGKSMDIALSKEMLGRVFDGAGRPIDALGEIYPEERRNINGSAINPVSRKYPRSCIYTGISAIDGCATLIRGQKLPIFSGSGMKHNELAAQLVRQARVPNQDGEFAIVFAAMGVKNDTAEFFRRSFEEAGALSRVVMFLNLASDPIIERILTPRCALTAAEFLAFEHGYHVLVVLTDMTSYCEALREFSSSKGEIPSRKGFPAYLYSDLASLYERAGMIHGRTGSVTQVPVLTMPNDDITHPIPDLTGYITEGQIVLDRELDQKGIYPPHRHSPLPVPPDEGRRGQGLHPGGSLRRIQPALCLLLQGAGRPQPGQRHRRGRAERAGQAVSGLRRRLRAQVCPPEPGGKPHHCGDAGPGVEAADHAAQGRAGPGGRQDHRGPLCGGGVEGAL